MLQGLGLSFPCKKWKLSPNHEPLHTSFFSHEHENYYYFIKLFLRFIPLSSAFRKNND
uniref:Uncharacterized protein n=1 Tax=Anguilla anguilla TaxID=7936 RepID=A0A0E9UR67_ANGAN